MELKDIVNGAIGPFYGYCNGYQNPGASGLGYISAFKIEVGEVKADINLALETIVSYDRASKNGAYFGQVNVLETSSYCGVNGAIWGYDLVKNDDLAKGKVKPLMLKKRHDGKTIKILPMQPLLDAAQSLWGTESDRRFPPLPGGIIPATVNAIVSNGEATNIWTALTMAVAENRNTESCLLVHQSGTGKIDEKELLEKFVYSIFRLAEDQGVKFKEVFFGFKQKKIRKGYIGVAQSFVPYLNLPPDIIKRGYNPSDLLNMTVSEWEKIMDFKGA